MLTLKYKIFRIYETSWHLLFALRRRVFHKGKLKFSIEWFVALSQGNFPRIMELEMLEQTDGNKNRSKNVFGDPCRIKIHIKNRD